MIGIIAPYHRGELTLAAVRLADWAVSLGFPVRFHALGPRGDGIHHLWDGRVLSWQSSMTSLRDCLHIVHFRADAPIVSFTKKLVGEKVVQTLVATGQDYWPKMAPVVAAYDRIVCPSRAGRQAIQANVFTQLERVSDSLLTTCLWDSGIPNVVRCGEVETGRIKVCVYCDRHSIDYCPALLTSLACETLSALPNLHMTFVSTSSWARRDRKDLKKLMDGFQGRFRCVGTRGGMDLVRIYHEHDWAVVPAVRGDFALAAAKAISCGLPVITNDVAPFAEHIFDGENGRLVPCELRTGASQMPIAVPHAGHWMHICIDSFSSVEKLMVMQDRMGRPRQRRTAFERFWEKNWGLA